MHPSLITTVNEITSEIDHLEAHVWSRYDLTQQLLLWGQCNLVKAEFGDVEAGSKTLAPLCVVPEDTALPVEEAQRAHRRLWTRITCNRQEFEKLDAPFLRSLQTRPYECLLVYTQFILGAVASTIENEVFDPVALKIGTLQREAGLLGRAHRREVDRAWSMPMKILMQEEYDRGIPAYPEDIEELIVEMAGTCIVQERLTLALIRMQARISGRWETDILEEVWDWASERIKIHPQ